MSAVKVLLVDDDEDDFILTRDILKESANGHTYEINWCNNFSEAINAMLKSHYDIYLVDYRLGKESGIALLNEAVKSNCTEPILIFTGKGDLKVDQEAMRLGAADYLVKDNLNGQMLERAIRYAIAQNKAHQQLKTSENKFRIIFERSKDPMLITTPYDQIVDANPAALGFFETTLPEILKLEASSLYKNAADRLSYTSIMNAEGSLTDFELEMVTLTGKIKFCSISSFLQVSQHANEELYYSIIHDLTFRLNQERDLALAEKLASSARIAKNLSYEVQNPLSNINLAIDELSNVLHHEENLVLTDIIKANCERINDLTNELIESTEVTNLNLLNTDLNALLIELLDDIRQDLDFQILYSPTESPLSIAADDNHLKSALKNIIQNAIEALPDEEKQINLTVEKRHAEVRIEITDNGHGISQENISKIFDPFFTTRNRATGLGLTRAQRIVVAHRGTVQAFSEAGRGTKIVVHLPAS